jgi:hypothetical protein
MKPTYARDPERADGALLDQPAHGRWAPLLATAPMVSIVTTVQIR